MRKAPQILEVTLRDGSYEIGFSFTAEDTKRMCSELESAGINWIEIGHGMGLNATNLGGKFKAKETDEGYLKAAQSAVENARYGMFCIPGTARVEDIDLLADLGGSFVRVGTNVTQVRESEPYIKRAKDLGLFVAANYMKSYAMLPEQFVELVKMSEQFGADMVYLVDSAGGMFPKGRHLPGGKYLPGIKDYFNVIKASSDIQIGFHGHDNLGFAIGNSLAAADFGAAFIDSSLQKLGRSEGNASTEKLAFALEKGGYVLGIDLLKLSDIGERFIQPLIQRRGISSLDVIAGYSDFHSSYMDKVLAIAQQYSIDPRKIIRELCKIDKVNAEDEVLHTVAKNIQKEAGLPEGEKEFLARHRFDSYIGGEQEIVKEKNE